jgi:uncharacterized protein YqeY
MNIEADIKWIQSELNHVKDPELIEVFVKLLKQRKSAIHSRLELYNQELEAANSRIDAGNFITHEDLEREASGW